MALTQTQIDQIRDAQRAYVDKRLPRAVRESRRRSRFERVGGKLRRKSLNPRRWQRQILYMESWREAMTVVAVLPAEAKK